MFPKSVEASIDLLLRLFYRFRRRVPDLLFDIAVAGLFRIQFRRIGRKPFYTDLPFRRQILFHHSRAMGLRSIPDHYLLFNATSNSIENPSSARTNSNGAKSLVVIGLKAA